MTRNRVGVFASLLLMTLSGAFPAGAVEVQTQQSEGSIYDLPVHFKNEDGKSVTLKDFAGKKVVITMAYTTCTFTCPRTVKKLEAIQKEADRVKKPAQFVLITLDPTVDTPAKLKQYRKETSMNNANWTFLTGTEEGVRQASMVLGIRYSKNSESGMISHDSKILLLDEKGVVTKVLNGFAGDVKGFFD